METTPHGVVRKRIGLFSSESLTTPWGVVSFFLVVSIFPDSFSRLGNLSFITKETFPRNDDNLPSWGRKAVQCSLTI